VVFVRGVVYMASTHLRSTGVRDGRFRGASVCDTIHPCVGDPTGWRRGADKVGSCEVIRLCASVTPFIQPASRSRLVVQCPASGSVDVQTCGRLVWVYSPCLRIGTASIRSVSFALLLWSVRHPVPSRLPTCGKRRGGSCAVDSSGPRRGRGWEGAQLSSWVRLRPWI
jgi:hypothetical protein